MLRAVLDVHLGEFPLQLFERFPLGVGTGRVQVVQTVADRLDGRRVIAMGTGCGGRGSVIAKQALSLGFIPLFVGAGGARTSGDGLFVGRDWKGLIIKFVVVSHDGGYGRSRISD